MVRTSARARHDLDTLAEYLVEDLERQTFEQRDPGLERAHEVELAVHGAARDRAYGRPLQDGDGRAIQRRPLRIGDQACDMSHGADCPRTTLPMQAAVP
jgi:hypothetical protein